MVINVKTETVIKLLEENRREKSWQPKEGKEFLTRTESTSSKRGKMDKLNFIKTKDAGPPRDTINRVGES